MAVRLSGWGSGNPISPWRWREPFNTHHSEESPLASGNAAGVRRYIWGGTPKHRKPCCPPACRTSPSGRPAPGGRALARVSVRMRARVGSTGSWVSWQWRLSPVPVQVLADISSCRRRRRELGEHELKPLEGWRAHQGQRTAPAAGRRVRRHRGQRTAQAAGPRVRRRSPES